MAPRQLHQQRPG